MRSFRLPDEQEAPLISPLTLSRKREPFDHPDFIFELKHDGFRAVAYIEDGQSKLICRRNNIFKSFVPLCESLKKLPVRNAILDGELICIDGNGVSLFNELMFRRGQPYFYVFDLMWLNGTDLRQLPLLKRKEHLRKLLVGANNPALLYADHVDQYGIDFFRMICEKNLEGIVAKHKDSRYDSSARWIKVKNPVYEQVEGRDELFEAFQLRSDPTSR